MNKIKLFEDKRIRFAHEDDLRRKITATIAGIERLSQ
jgi:hypothetical protein